MYKLDGNKLYCNQPLDNGDICGGVIDYDDGFNKLICTKCGKRYRAIDLKKSIDENLVVRKGGNSNMKVSFGKGEARATDDCEFDVTPKYVSRKGYKSKVGDLEIKVVRGNKTVIRSNPSKEEEEKEKEDLQVRGTVVMRDGPSDSAEEVHPVNEEEDDDKFVVSFKKKDTTTVSDEPEEQEEVKEKSVSVNFDDSDEQNNSEESDEPDPEEQEEVTDEQPVEESEDINEAEESETDENESSEEDDEDEYEDPPYYDVGGTIVRSDSVIDDEGQPFKAILLQYHDGDNFLLGNNGAPILVSEIDGRPIDEVCVITKEAYAELTSTIDDLKKKLANHSKQENKSPRQIALEKGEEFYYDDKGNKRNAKTGKFAKRSKEETKETDKGKYNTASPLFKDDESQESIPVGAVPPEEVTSNVGDAIRKASEESKHSKH